MKKKLTLIEKRMLRLLYQTKISMTIYEVAKELEISYPTAKKYMNKLVKEGYLIEE